MVAHWLLLLALTAVPVRAADTVRVEVAFGEERPTGTLQVETTWLGETAVWALRDDGEADDARKNDGVFTGTGSGDEVRALSLTILDVAEDGPSTPLWAGTERLATGHQTLTFAAHDAGNGLRLRRSAVALPGPAMEQAEATSVAALLGWTGILLIYVIGLVLTSRRGRRR